jgi:hypothetical protein
MTPCESGPGDSPCVSCDVNAMQAAEALKEIELAMQVPKVKHVNVAITDEL